MKSEESGERRRRTERAAVPVAGEGEDTRISAAHARAVAPCSRILSALVTRGASTTILSALSGVPRDSGRSRLPPRAAPLLCRSRGKVPRITQKIEPTRISSIASVWSGCVQKSMCYLACGSHGEGEILKLK